MSGDEISLNFQWIFSANYNESNIGFLYFFEIVRLKKDRQSIRVTQKNVTNIIHEAQVLFRWDIIMTFCQ